jgi:hypothetical protein
MVGQRLALPSKSLDLLRILEPAARLERVTC